MSRRKVCVVVTARPSYSRVQTALRAINEDPTLDLQLVVAASALLDRYGSAVDYIKRDGFEIAAKVYSVLEGATTSATPVRVESGATVWAAGERAVIQEADGRATAITVTGGITLN
ncbi:MAG: hypothetical protein ABI652_08220, partial [Acidobacteriota bacterium]